MTNIGMNIYTDRVEIERFMRELRHTTPEPPVCPECMKVYDKHNMHCPAARHPASDLFLPEIPNNQPASLQILSLRQDLLYRCFLHKQVTNSNTEKVFNYDMSTSLIRNNQETFMEYVFFSFGTLFHIWMQETSEFHSQPRRERETFRQIFNNTRRSS